MTRIGHVGADRDLAPERVSGVRIPLPPPVTTYLLGDFALETLPGALSRAAQRHRQGSGARVSFFRVLRVRLPALRPILPHSFSDGLPLRGRHAPPRATRCLSRFCGCVFIGSSPTQIREYRVDSLHFLPQFLEPQFCPSSSVGFQVECRQWSLRGSKD